MTEAIRISLLRHGRTFGNTKQRYIGTTDEPILDAEREALKNRHYPPAEILFTSPKKRCVQTASCLYPDLEPIRIPDLTECDFGEFENKNYLELAGNPHYQEWVDSGGTLPFPGGESREEVSARTLRGFSRAVRICVDRGFHKAAMVVHGGTIMTILSMRASEKRDYYSWHVGNGEGYYIQLDPDAFLSGEANIEILKVLR